MMNVNKQVCVDTAASIRRDMMDPGETLVMGDFWSGNIWIDMNLETEQLRQLFAIDCDSAQYRLSSEDLCQIEADLV